jgi:hypothetical protein
VAKSIQLYLTHGRVTEEEKCCVMELRRVVLMYCSKCLKEVIEKNQPIKLKKYRGRWNFLDRLEIGDSFVLGTIQDYDNARRSMHSKKIPYRSAKMSDGSGWRIWKVNKDTAGQL